MDLRPLARDERADFATFLATLSLRQWEAPTLCADWRVRDVVAHVISYDELSVRGLVGRFAKGWFLPDRVNAVGLAEYNMRSPEELLALLKDHVEPRGLPAAFGGMVALVDGVIHHQDIRRPLGMPRDIPAERLLPALRCALTAPVIRGFWRVRGGTAGSNRPGLVHRGRAGSTRSGGSAPDDHCRAAGRGGRVVRTGSTETRGPHRSLTMQDLRRAVGTQVAAPGRPLFGMCATRG